MKKKLVGLLLIIFFSCGCTSIESQSYEDIIDSTLSNTIRTTNITRAGYKYYLPQGMRLIEYEGSNEIISHNNDTYYLYVDYVSYYNKVVEEYEEKMLLNSIINNSDPIHTGIIVSSVNEEYIVTRTVLAKAAEEILNTRGVNAAFVVGRTSEKQVSISARSTTSFNVQIIMEKMGGGGHFSASATQISNVSIHSVMEQLKENIDVFLRDGKI